MPIELTDEDRAIRSAPKYMRDTNDGKAALRAIYRAGIERAAKECEQLSVCSDRRNSAWECAAAIRALLKPLP